MVSRASLKIYAIALGIFLLGGVAGGAVSHGLSEHRHREFAAGGPEAFERRKVSAMVRKLSLSEEQEAHVRSILREDRESRRELTEQVFERCGEPLRAHRDAADQKIRAVLTPEQQKRYEKLVGERRLDPFAGPPPHHHGGPPSHGGPPPHPRP
jgi:Spy/CpxP family protein refolding chaperone